MFLFFDSEFATFLKTPILQLSLILPCFFEIINKKSFACAIQQSKTMSNHKVESRNSQ
jgi:hypothetical protein